MALRIDWKRSLIMTAILIAILFVLQSFLDSETYCIAAIIVFIVVLAAGNLIGRGR
jgi:membrane protein required for beta-lactamase induction